MYATKKKKKKDLKVCVRNVSSGAYLFLALIIIIMVSVVSTERNLVTQTGIQAKADKQTEKRID